MIISFCGLSQFVMLCYGSLDSVCSLECMLISSNLRNPKMQYLQKAVPRTPTMLYPAWVGGAVLLHELLQEPGLFHLVAPSSTFSSAERMGESLGHTMLGLPSSGRTSPRGAGLTSHQRSLSYGHSWLHVGQKVESPVLPGVIFY